MMLQGRCLGSRACSKHSVAEAPERSLPGLEGFWRPSCMSTSFLGVAKTQEQSQREAQGTRLLTASLHQQQLDQLWHQVTLGGMCQHKDLPLQQQL